MDLPIPEGPLFVRPFELVQRGPLDTAPSRAFLTGQENGVDQRPLLERPATRDPTTAAAATTATAGSAGSIVSSECAGCRGLGRDA